MGTNNRSSTSSEFTIFLDTSLDTHLVVTICGNNTISELIRILESEHQRCLGRINIQALKVNWKGHWYHLSDDIHVRRVVNGDNQEGFLFADALSLENNEEFQLGSKIAEKENLIETDASIERRDVSCDITKAGIKDNTSRDVSCDAAVRNRSTFEEPCRASASDLDNMSDSGYHPENDAYKETEVSRKYTECRKDTSEQCNTIVKDGSQSQPTSKKKREFEEVAGLKEPLKENNSLIFDSGVEDFKPEIASEVAVEKNISTILHVSQSVCPSKKKRKFENVSKDRKKNKSPNPLSQVLDATPARRGDTKANSMVPSTVINVKILRGEDVASTGRQGQQENHCTPSQVLQSHLEVPSSLDIDSKKKSRKKKASDFNGDSLVKSGTEHILGSECDMSLAEPQEVVEAENVRDKANEEDNNLSLKNREDISEKETEGETGSAEKALKETELSQKNDSEAMLIEKHEVPDKGKRDGNDATSELLNTVGSVTPSKKKKKQKKTNDVNGDHLVKQNISVGRPLKPDQSGKLPKHGFSYEADRHKDASCEGKDRHKDASCEGKDIKFVVPDQIQKEVVSFGEVHAEETARSKETDNKLMPKKNRKNWDSTSHSTELQSPLKSHDCQRISEKSQAGNSVSVKQVGSTKNDSVVAQPKKMIPKKVAKTRTKAVSSDASDQYSDSKRSERLELTQKYTVQFIVGMRQYISGSMDVKDDGNCGFRAVASAMGFGGNHWRKVRRDLMNELKGSSEFYADLFGGQAGVERLCQRLDHFGSHGAPLGKWMEITEMGHLIATYYGVVVVYLTDNVCFTFLPLRENIEGKFLEGKLCEIGIGYVNKNHFVQVCLLSGHPLPPVPPNWFHHADDKARTLYFKYQKRIEKYQPPLRPPRVISPKNIVCLDDN